MFSQSLNPALKYRDCAYQQAVQNAYSASILWIISICQSLILILDKPCAHKLYIEDHICLRISCPKTAIATTTEIRESASTVFK